MALSEHLTLAAIFRFFQPESLNAFIQPESLNA